jgi:uncharacterized membrane protein YfcA
MKELILFAVVNLIAATLSGAAGGGGGLVSLPLLVQLGLSPATAIATGKFAGLGLSAGSSLRFFREKLADRRLLIVFSVFAVIASLLGSLLLLAVKDYERQLEVVMGLVILFVGIPLLYFKHMGVERHDRSQGMRSLGFVLLFIGIVFQAALGGGIGSLQLIVLMGCFGMTALTASATRRMMQLLVAVTSLVVFILSGIVDYRFGLVGLGTSLVGGYLGAHIAIKKGNKFVINLFALTSAILALQLLWR